MPRLLPVCPTPFVFQVPQLRKGLPHNILQPCPSADPGQDPGLAHIHWCNPAPLLPCPLLSPPGEQDFYSMNSFIGEINRYAQPGFLNEPSLRAVDSLRVLTIWKRILRFCFWIIGQAVQMFVDISNTVFPDRIFPARGR